MVGMVGMVGIYVGCDWPTPAADFLRPPGRVT